MEFLGEQTLSFLHAAENDDEIIQLLHEGTIDGSFKVSIWNGSSRELSGLIYPEANVTPFSRLVRVKFPSGVGDTVKVRLYSLANNWKIDAVELNWTAVEKLEKKVVPLLSIGGQLSEDQINLIQEKDNQYTILLPSQNVDLTNNNLNASTGIRFAYAPDVGGYMYEWLPEKSRSSIFAGFGNIISTDKTEFVKFLLHNRSLLLPPLYAEWLKRK
jgi:hypothetical protein